MIQVSGRTENSSCCRSSPCPKSSGTGMEIWLSITSCKCPWQGRIYLCPSLRTAASRRALPTTPAFPNKDTSEKFPFSSSLPLHSGCWMIKDEAAKPSQSPVPSEQDPQAPTSPWMSARFQCKFSGWFIKDQAVPLPRGSSTSSPLR